MDKMENEEEIDAWGEPTEAWIQARKAKYDPEYDPYELPIIENRIPVEYGVKGMREKKYGRGETFDNPEQESFSRRLGQVCAIVMAVFLFHGFCDLFPLKIEYQGETTLVTVNTFFHRITTLDGEVIKYKRQELLGVVYYTMDVNDTHYYMNTKYPKKNMGDTVGQALNVEDPLVLDIWEALISWEKDYKYNEVIGRYVYTGVSLSALGFIRAILKMILFIPGITCVFFPEHLASFLNIFYAFWEEYLHSPEYFILVRKVGNVLLGIATFFFFFF